MSRTVSSSINFDQVGKFEGYLQIGDSTNTNGWATFHLPIISIKSGDGPTVLITGGNHGDEYEGQFAIANLVRQLKVEDIKGTLIAIPSLSFPASYLSTRLWPDGTNFNRIFPGKESGTIPEKIAHYLATELILRLDAVIDIHSGGRGHYFLPSATMTWSEEPKYRAELLKNLNGWQCQNAMIFPSQPGTNENSLFPGHVAALGKSLFTGEFGGAGVTTATSNKITRAALISALKSINLLPPQWLSQSYDHNLKIGERRFIDMRAGDSYHWAEDEGLYQNSRRLGEEINMGEEIGAIHYTESSDRQPTRVFAQRSGILGVIRGFPRIRRGDCLALIGPSYLTIDAVPNQPTE
ncbi:MAG: succinylglutamate desuccinylase/aspartoacylase family protein [Actinomycetota bacterium]|nr:succinylglutamate desuccinylase/aspartoacylase family protein [Actinomycetota bacterium]